MPNTLICVSHAGGQGKTTLAQLLYIWGNNSKTPSQFKLASADFLDLDKDGRRSSKIGKLFPGKVEEFGTGAELSAVRTENNMNASLRYWDKLGNIFLIGGYVVDLGANVIKPISEWAKDRKLGAILSRKGAPKIDVFCICKAEKHATDDVEGLVKMFVEESALPPQNIYIVLNEAAGPFGGMKLDETLSAKHPDAKLTFIKLPRCQSEIWAPMEQFGVSIDRVLAMTEDEICETLEVDVWTASAGLEELKSWFETSLQNFRTAGAIPKAKA